MTADDLLRTFVRKTGFEPIEHALQTQFQDGHAQYRAVGRVVGKHVDTWRFFLLHALLQAQRAAWSVDISRSYTLKKMPGDNYVVVYAWRLIFQDRQRVAPIQHHFKSINQMLVDYKPAPVAAMETETVQLYGTKRNTGPGTGGGYASSVFSPVVGPAAVAVARARGQG